MTKKAVNIVWFKRDLRVVDHQPLLAAAAAKEAVIPLYVIEDDYWQLPDVSKRQWVFIRACLIELDIALRKLGQGLVIMRASITQVLEELAQQFHVVGLYSHLEIGHVWSEQRNKAVEGWCQEHQVSWQQYSAFATCSARGAGQEWEEYCSDFMQQPVKALTKKLPVIVDSTTTLPNWRMLHLTEDGSQDLQEPGRKQGLLHMQSFLETRGQQYHYAMASPLGAYLHCSRLSPYLTYGCLSIREVMQALQARQEQLQQQPYGERRLWINSLQSLHSRLQWRCQFMQQVACDFPHLPYENVLPAMNGLREHHFNKHYFVSWQRGETGYPFLDACMRALRATGWMNFRMRAMLISFSSYHLWQHWEKPACYLAQLFSDYEPSIHYMHVQLYSGTMGTHPPKIYNPIKQSHEQDANGEFIRKWVPELRYVPNEFIHEPWLMSGALQKRYGCELGRHYPAPIVKHGEVMQMVKEKLRAPSQEIKAAKR